MGKLAIDSNSISVYYCIITTTGVFRLITKLFSIFGRFRFGLDFPTEAVLGNVDPHLSELI